MKLYGFRAWFTHFLNYSKPKMQDFIKKINNRNKETQFPEKRWKKCSDIFCEYFFFFFLGSGFFASVHSQAVQAIYNDFTAVLTPQETLFFFAHFFPKPVWPILDHK